MGNKELRTIHPLPSNERNLRRMEEQRIAPRYANITLLHQEEIDSFVSQLQAQLKQIDDEFEKFSELKQPSPKPYAMSCYLDYFQSKTMECRALLKLIKEKTEDFHHLLTLMEKLEDEYKMYWKKINKSRDAVALVRVEIQRALEACIKLLELE